MSPEVFIPGPPSDESNARTAEVVNETQQDEERKLTQQGPATAPYSQSSEPPNPGGNTGLGNSTISSPGDGFTQEPIGARTATPFTNLPVPVSEGGLGGGGLGVGAPAAPNGALPPLALGNNQAPPFQQFVAPSSTPTAAEEPAPAPVPVDNPPEVSILPGKDGIPTETPTGIAGNPAIELPPGQVAERGLEGGDFSKFASTTGLINIGDADGVGDISTVTIAGQVFTLAQLQAINPDDPSTFFTIPLEANDGDATIEGFLIIDGYTNTSSTTGQITFTFTLADPVNNADTTNPNTTGDYTRIPFEVTVTDSAGEQATAQSQITIIDDIPVVSVSANTQEEPLLTTQDAETIGDASDTDTSSANFSGVFSTTPNYGADGDGSTVTTYSLDLLKADGSASGLTSNGDAINLFEVNGTVVGSTATTASEITAGNTVFSLTVDSTTGVVTSTQFAEIDHAPEGTTNAPFDNQLTSLADGLVQLTANAQTTDADGDVATSSASIDLGGNIRFADDGPTQTLVAVDGTFPAALEVSLDETFGLIDPVKGEEVASATGPDTTDDVTGALAQQTTAISGGLAGLFTPSGAFGADGAGALSATGFSLVLSADSVTTNLIATDGGPVTLSKDPLTGDIVGKDTDGDTVLTIAIVDVNGNPQLQTTLFEALNTTNNDKFDESTDLLTTNGGSLSLRADVTRVDGDGDSVTASSTVSLASGTDSVFAFQDDGPTQTLSAVDDSFPAALEVSLDETLGLIDPVKGGEVASATGPDTTDDVTGALAQQTTAVSGGLANLFSDAATDGTFGSDGAGALSATGFSLVLSADSVTTNLIATDGGPVTLSKDPLTGDIVGKDTDGDTVLTIAIVDVNGNPQLQTTLFEALNTTNNDKFDESTDLLTTNGGSLSLRADVTRVDGDGDSVTASSTVSLASGTDSVFAFQDDGPTQTLSAVDDSFPAALEVSLDETLGLIDPVKGGEVASATGPDTTDDVTGALAQQTTAVSGGLANLFSDAATDGTFGSDGAGALSATGFSLVLSADSVTTNLIATDGGPVTLSKDPLTGDIVGKDTDGDTVLTIAIVDVNGNPQLQTTLFEALNTTNNDKFDESTDLLTTNGGSLSLRADVTRVDGDGDSVTASSTVSLASGTDSVFAFQDDGPTQTLSAVDDSFPAALEVSLDETLGLIDPVKGGEVASATGPDTTDDVTGALAQQTTAVSGGLANLFSDAATDGTFGSDGAGALSATGFSLVLSADSVTTNLIATDGGPVTLSKDPLTGDIVGKDTDGDTVLTIAIVDVNGNPQLQTTLFEALNTTNNDKFDESTDLLTTNGGSLSLRADVTRVDGDGDSVTASSTVSLASGTDSVFAFQDDGPTQTLSAVDDSFPAALEVSLDETLGLIDPVKGGEVASATGPDTTDDVTGALAQQTTAVSGGLANLFSDAATDGTFGSDGAGALSATGFSLVLSADSVTTNLIATDGGPVTLSKDPLTGDIVGKDTDGDTVLTIAIVDVNGNPQLQTTLFEALNTTNNDKFDESTDLLTTNGGSLSLRADVTRVDGDGDSVTASSTVSLASGTDSVFAFQDDGPTQTLSAVDDSFPAALEVSLDETLGLIDPVKGGEVASATGPDTTDDVTGALAQQTTAVSGGLANLFSDAATDGTFGSDGAGALSATGFSLVLSADSVTTNLIATDGGPVTLSKDPLTGDIVGKDTDGDTVLTIAIVDVNGNPQLQTTLFEALNTTNNDKFDESTDLLTTNGGSLSLRADVTRVDGDGDSVTASSTVSLASGTDSVFAFQDDGPTAIQIEDPLQVNEGGEPVTGRFVFNGGADGASITSINRVTPVDGVITVEGAIGTLVVDAQSGEYTFTAKDDTSDLDNDVFTLTVTDGDGDAVQVKASFDSLDMNVPFANRTFAIVDDDGLPGGNPLSIVGDATGQTPSEAVFTGTLSAGFGADGPGGVTFADLDGDKAPVGTEEVTYAYSLDTGTGVGILTATITKSTDAERIGTNLFKVEVGETSLNYKVTLLDNVLHDAGSDENEFIVSLPFVVSDSDGSDPATGNLTITFDDDGPSISGTTNVSVDEEGLSGGNLGDSYASGDLAGNAITATGTLGVLFGADGAAATGSGFTLSANGATWDAATRTLTGPDSAWTVVVDANGSYTFNLLKPLTHPTANTEDDLVINVGFTATDKDGDTKAGTFSVTVDDDGPVISGTTNVSVDEEGLSGGNLGDSYASGDLAGNAITATGTLGVLFGADGAAATGSGFTLSANGATWDAATRTLTGPDSAWTVVVDANGSYTFNLLKPLTHPTANTEDDLVINVGFTATDKDGDTKAGTFSVTVDDDGPVISGTTNVSVDEEGLSGGNLGDSYASGDLAGNAITATGTLGVLFGADGAAATGSGFTLSANGATWDAATRTLTGPDSAWTVVVDANGSYTFNLLKPLTHPTANTEDDLVINVGFTATDKDGDTKAGTFSVTVDDDGPVISGTTNVSVDEEGLSGGNLGDSYASGDLAGNAITATGTLGVLFGADGAAATGSGFTLSANGATWDAATRTLTGPDSAWTVVVDANGSYTFNLLKPLTHPTANTEDDLVINVGFTATDKDGDTKAGTFSVTVDDDGPVISGTTNVSVDEEGLSGGNLGDSYASGDLAGNAITATGTLGVLFGADGAAATGSGFTLSANGATWDAATRTLTGPDSAWTVVVDANGSYTFNLLKPLTHPTANTEDDLVINVGFTATDKDGDTKAGTFSVTVDDDGPVISGTTNVSVDEEGLSGGNLGDSYASGDLAGNAITATGTLGVLFGADGAAATGSGFTLSANGATWDAATRTLTGPDSAWTVVVDANGSYTFNLLKPLTHPTANTEDDLVINVGFTATDKDGDTKAGTFSVTVDDDGPVISGTTNVSVDEEGLSGGNLGDSYASGDLAGNAITATGTLGVLFGADGAAATGSGFTLSANGATWDAATRTLTGPDSAWTVVVDANGSYTFNLLKPLTHPTANTEDDLVINVGFTATDKDGDTKAGTFSVTVDDDGPVISGTTNVSVDEEGLSGGNLGDSYASGDLAGNAITATGTLGVLFGADGAAATGSGFTLSANGATWDAATRTLTGPDSAWTVVVDANGSYTFNLLKPLTHPTANTEDDLVINVGFTATDKDGDTKAGTFSVTVDDDGPVISGTTNVSVDEEGLSGGNLGDSYASGDLAGNAITATGTLGVLFGADGAAATGSGFTLSANGATWDAATRTLTGPDSAWTVVVDANGSYTFNLLKPLTHPTANTEDDLVINVGFTATDKDGDTKAGTFSVTVDDDGPVISGTTNVSVDEEGLSGGNLGDSYASGDLAGNAITATGTLGVLFGADGAAATGSGFTLSANGATWDAATRTLTGPDSAWTVVVDANGSYTFNLLKPLTHPTANTEDDLVINVGFTATDKDGDTKAGTFSVTVDDDGPVISGTTNVSVDEEGLSGGNLGDSYASGDLAGNAITATGTLGVLFGADGAAATGSGFTLSANGATWDAATRTLTGPDSAWTVVVDANGSYTFNLLKPLTHPTANTEDDLVINVGFTATDKDGDTKAGTFSVTVDDDGPVISGTTNVSVDEEGLSGGNLGDSYASGDLAGNAITATGTLGVLFGADGAAATGSGFTLSANGATWDAATRTLTGPDSAWTVVVDANGSYTFNLLKPLTHPTANTEDDLVINVGFTATDKDGDTKAGTFSVTVDDDGPVISGTTNVSVDEEGLSGGNLGDSYASGDLAGNAITATGTLGVLFGADGAAATGSGFTLSANGATWDAATRTLTGPDSAWTVVVDANGSYTFNLLKPLTHPTANTEDDLVINVGFTATDKDGDTKAGTFSVTVDDDGPVISGTTNVSVDEEGLSGGNLGDSYASGDLAGNAITATGTLGVLFGADGAAATGSGFTLSANGATWDAATRTLTGPDSAWTVVVDANGSYTFNLLKPLTHPTANTEDDLVINVGFTATDKDGDTKAGTFSVTVDDDGPVISGTTNVSVDEEGLSGGNLGDSYASGDLAGNAITATGTLGVLFGADGAAATGSGFTLSANGATWDAATRTLTGPDSAWTVVVDANGSYTFNLLKPLTHPTANTEDDLVINVGFTATDKDGDTKAGTFSVTVDDDGPVISGTTNVSVDEEGLSGGNLGDSYASGDLAGNAITATGTLGVLFGADGAAATGSGFTLSANGATWDAATRTLTGPDSAWTVVVDANGSYTFNLLKPLTHPTANTEDDLVINVGFTATDKDGDTKAGTFSVTVDDDGPVISGTTNVSVDEEGLSGGNLGDSYASGDLAGNAITATGTLGVLFGADGAAATGSGFTLSANGATWDAATRTLTGPDSAWTVVVDANGSYTFNLLKPLTHPTANTEDDLVINVGFTATDKDGDTKAGTFSVTVDDDGPVISGTTNVSVDEEGLSGGNLGDSYASGDLAGNAITATGTLGVLFGADGAAATGSGFTLSANGATWDAATRTLTGPDSAWTVVVDANGSYTFNLLKPLTHPTANTEDDLVINVGFTATDKDGDTKAGTFSVTVDDDGPVISGTTNVSVDEEGLSGGNLGDSYASGDLAGNAITATGTLGVLFGADGAAATGSGFTLSANGATWDAATRTLTGPDSAWTVVVDANGSYTFNLLKPLTHPTANTEDDLVINVGFTATDKDGDTKAGTFSVTVDDDGPVISGTTNVSVDEEGLSGGNLGDSYASGDLAGNAITATGTLGVLFGADGAAATGSGFTLSANGATWDAATRTLTGPDSAWTVVVDANGSYTFNLLKPLTHPTANTEDDLVINVGFTATDKDGDTKAGTFSVTVDDDGPVISGTTNVSVDEEGLSGGNLGDSYASGDLAGNAITATGTLGVLFGADGAAATGSGFTLSANGATWDAATRTLTGPDSAWTVVVDANGSYTFNLLKPLTHPTANTEDDLVINVGFTATDKDGDTKAGTFSVTVDDDGPVISGTTNVSVDEEGLSGGNLGDSYASGDLAGNAITATGTLGVLFGADGAAATGSGFTLSANGATWDAATRTLTGPDSAWTVVVDANGSYTFNLLKPLTHPTANTEDDLVINVGFTATDKDGDTKAGTFSVTVDDDGPVISGTTNVSVDEEGLSGGNLGDSYASGDLAGNAITATGTLGVLFGADGAAATGSGFTLSANGATWDAATRTLTGPDSAWTVVVDANGSYTFNLLKPLTHPTANTEDDLVINVGFTATDKDGDTKAGTFSVTVDDDGPVISGTTNVSVDEEGLSGGNLGDSYASGDLAGNAITATGTLGVLFGADGAAATGSGFTLSANGATWDAATRTLTGPDSAWTVVVDANGSYTFNLLKPLTHPTANTEDDLVINVGFTATDKDGDTKAGTFSVTVDDDGPVISGTTNVSVDEEGLSGGNLGDSYASGDLAGNAITATGTLGVLFGADGAAATGSGFTLSANGATWDAATRTLTGPDSAWTVVVDANGSYTFNLLKPLTHPTANTEDDLVINVGFTATDKDGDTKAGTFSVTVDDDGPVISFLNTGGTALAASTGISGTWTGSSGADTTTVFYDPSTPTLNDGYLHSVSFDGVTVNNAPLLDSQFSVTSTTYGTDYAKISGTFFYDNPKDDQLGQNVNFELQVNSNGSYKLTTSLPAGTTTFDNAADTLTLKAGSPNNEKTYTITDSTTNESIDVLFKAGAATETVVVSSDGIGISNNIFQYDKGNESIEINPLGANKVSAINLLFTGSGNNAFTSQDSIVVQVHGLNSGGTSAGSPQTITISAASGESLSSYSINAATLGYASIDRVVLTTNSNTTDVKLGFAIVTQGTKPVAPVPAEFTFTATVGDSDGDTTSSTFKVTVSDDYKAPIALDLNGNGVEYSDLASSKATFDYGGDGIAEHTAWITGGDALLAFDHNHDGIVNDGSEISFAQYHPDAKTDLEGLKLAFDTNQDNVFDAKDAHFTDFGIWTDADGDGITDQGEFQSLSDAGIASFDLSSDGKTYTTADGDVLVHGTLSYENADGSTGLAQDVAFATDASTPQSQGTAEPVAEASIQELAAALLPEENVHGLVDQFLTNLHTNDTDGTTITHSDVVYELDAAISTFIADHGISVEQYHEIHQQVVDTIAHDLQTHGLVEDGAISQDASGHADGSDVLAAVDTHFHDLYANHFDNNDVHMDDYSSHV